MHVTRLMTAAAFAALIAGPAAAQSTTTQTQTTTTNTGDAQTSTSMSGSMDATTASPLGLPAGANPAAAAALAGTPNVPTGTLIAPPGLVVSTSASGSVVIANAPIPDNVENRQRYGQPESRSGRMKLGEGPVRQLPTASRAMANARTSAQAE